MNDWLKAPFRFIRSMYHSLVYLWQGRSVIAPQVVIAHRESVCKPCMYNDGVFCRKCKCLLGAKVALSAEECPDGRWKALTS